MPEVVTQIAIPETGLMSGKRRLTLSPAIVATIVVAEQTFTCPGIPANAQVSVTPPAINGAIAPCYARRTAANTVGIGWVNPTAGGITPTAAQVYEISWSCEQPTA